MVAESHVLETLSNGVPGPPQYAAYELVTGSTSKHTKATDVWAYGITVYVSKMSSDAHQYLAHADLFYRNYSPVDVPTKTVEPSIS